MVDQKSNIIEALKILRNSETHAKNVFKARAYARVISEIEGHQGTIETMKDVEQLTGIGAKIRQKIAEILDTGKLEAAEMIKSDKTMNIRDDLLKIYGVGPVKANSLVKEMQIVSIADLRVKYDKDPSILNDKQAIGLKYYEDINLRIPREEMETHKKELMKTIFGAQSEFQAEIVGSYRRGAKDSGDIDVLMTLPDALMKTVGQRAFEDVSKQLEASRYVVEMLAKGLTKYMGICRLPGGKGRRLDLMMTREAEFPYAILYFTGSDKFNIAMRKHAVGLGYTMNEHGMKAIKDDVPNPPIMKNEKDIFHFLNLEYVDPEKRIDGKSLRMKKNNL